MAKLTRRSFAKSSLAALAVGAAGEGLLSAPVLAKAPAAAAEAAVGDPLAPIAPELRPAAQTILDMKLPPINAATIRQLPPDFGAPKQPLLSEIKVEEKTIPSLSGGPDVRIFVINSDAATRRPAILHTHGGGFVLGTARTALRGLQEIARDLECVIVTVDYRLAPETRYIGSVDDNYSGLKWLHDNADRLGVDTARIALMGESAGGGHAALLAITARDRGEVPLVLQVLIYPMLDDRTGSTVTLPPHIATVGWKAEQNRFGWESFLGVKPGSAAVPVAAVPARTPSLAGLPPAWIGVGAVDLFMNEDVEYARRLNDANVPTELMVVPGAFHAFDLNAADTAPARRFIKSRLNALRRAFGYEVEV